MRVFSRHTIEMIVRCGAPAEQISALLHSMDRDAHEAFGCDHDEAACYAANAVEAGLCPDEVLRSLAVLERMWAELPAPSRYRRRVPSNWAQIRARIFARDGEVCRYCGETEGPFHIDHITPLRRGGSHDDDNLCVACEPCNVSKKDRLVSEWGGRK